MWQLMVYAVGIAAALGVAGWCLERLALARDLPRRWVWPLTMVLSIAWTVSGVLRVGPAAGTASPAPPIDARPMGTVELANPVAAVEALAPLTPLANDHAPSNQWSPPATRTLIAMWAGTSGLMLLYLAGAGLVLRRRASGWRRATVLGRDVLVSESTGPALLGTLRPRIVVPRWFMTAPAGTQRLILQHEEQHIAARDPLLLRLATLVTLALPWNLPLWWQLGRLRQSIEMDCDARVLGSGAAPSRYGQVLLEVTRRAGRVPATLIAMSEPVSTLERRIRNLVPDPARHSVVRASAALLSWCACIGVAGALEAPPLPQRETTAERQDQPIRVAAQQPAQSTRAAGQPAAQAATSTRPADANQLPRLLPPPPRTPRSSTKQAVIEQAILANHPGLVNGPERDGDAFVSVEIAPDDSIARTRMQFVAPGDATGLAEATAAASRATLVPESGQMLIPRGHQLAGGAAVKSQVRVSYRYLPPPPEEMRVARIGGYPRADVVAILDHHFPGVWRPSGGGEDDALWLVFSRDGRVLRSGRISRSSGPFNFQSRVPDLELKEMSAMVGGKDGPTPLWFAWVAP